MATNVLPDADHRGLRVIEFYAGVGGYHFALEQALGVRAHVVAAIDINTTATDFYRHNFPSTPHFNRNICGMTSEWLDALLPDIFVLSPPCQPFTRQGLRGDSSDHRTDSFFHLMELMLRMSHPPKYLMMENVEGFQNSQTRNHFTEILEKTGFAYQEFLLSPVQFGIPNSRLRYYLLAKKEPSNFVLQVGRQLVRDPTALLTVTCAHRSTVTGNEMVVPDANSQLTQNPSPPNNHTHTAPADILTCPQPKPLHHYLQRLSDTDLDKYLVPSKVLGKCAVALDIVTPQSTQCCCFTKAYTHFAVGTGSVLYEGTTVSLDEAFRTFQEGQSQGRGLGECVQCLLPLKLRYFTPREVANLMSFPEKFSFPPTATLQQCYRVLGNSLNVHVVTCLMKYLFHDTIVHDHVA